MDFLDIEKITPLIKSPGQKQTLFFFFKLRTYEVQENRPFLRGIQNDDAYLFFYLGVAGPG